MRFNTMRNFYRNRCKGCHPLLSLRSYELSELSAAYRPSVPLKGESND